MSFAVNNSVMILYHEIGHLFVGEFGLPVLGKNEDAADSLSAVFLLEEADEWSDEVLRDAAEGWVFSPYNGKGELGDWAFMGQHSLDTQRSFFTKHLSNLYLEDLANPGEGEEAEAADPQ